MGLPPKYVYSKPFEIPVDAYFTTTFCKNKISGGYMELNGPVTNDGKAAAMSHHWEGYIKYARPI